MRGELARLPLGNTNILSYANNPEHKIKNPLLREAYIIFLQTNNKERLCYKTLKLKHSLICQNVEHGEGVRT